MASSEQIQAEALAGIFLALSQVRDIATHGHGGSRRTLPCLRALLGNYDGDMLGLYGGRDALAPGLHLMIDHLRRPDEATVTRYLVGILQLERKLAGDRRRFERVREGVRAAASQAQYFGAPNHENVISNLGELYQETVSQLRPRIIVQGDRAYLEDARNAALIRALLLSALRAAAIWRAAGGNRWRLVLRRRALIDSARRLLATT
ncbi:MAG TPA: high frequency lysogenization protein HflD [Gammaproteobacteria bacterium]|nr:high frequency lysogenization protein HflD [Gammaproteobacteria bacterium]